MHSASYGWALSCCGYDREQATDVLQIVYLKVLERKARFDGRAGFKTWLFSVIRITALNERRKQLLRKLGLARHENRSSREITELDIAQATEREQQQEIVKKALEDLSSRQRQVLHLVFYQDLTLEETAKVLSISLGSARTHYERGKKRLRALLCELRSWR